jgi:phage terminase large subunit-like protein
LTTEELTELLNLTSAHQRLIEREKIYSYYPDTGPLRRELYQKHLKFFAAGATEKERCMLAANRVGKTEGVGGYELTLHLTGEYPAWWVGKRFERPTKWWAAGDTSKTVRDILQAKLVGPPGNAEKVGTGLIPQAHIIRTTPKQGIPDAIESVHVKHVTGGTSVLQLKSYDQGREAFQGTEQDGILLDEEPPLEIYIECVIRTMTTDGIVLCTFTPLEGLSSTVLHFLPDGSLDNATRFVVMASWDDVPHLSTAQKDLLWASIPPYQRDARSKGIPQLGSGAIYPVPESDFLCDPFDIPVHWPRSYALDVGWNRTAALWLANDQQNQTVYLYSEHYRGHAEPSVHANSIRARGEWIPGVIDPAARGRGQKDGAILLNDYRDLGLELTEADNAVESGIYAVWERLSAGRLKVFRTLQHWLSEYRLYRRDDKGRIVKINDHLMDCTRYGVQSGVAIAVVKPVPRSESNHFPSEF